MNSRFAKLFLCLHILFGYVDMVSALDRWFEYSPGLRLSGLISTGFIRGEEHVGSNRVAGLHVDFGVGLSLNFRLSQYVAVELGTIYERNGILFLENESYLEYLSCPMLFELWIMEKFGFRFGVSHSFLLRSTGKPDHIMVDLKPGQNYWRPYVLSAILGAKSVLYQFDNGTKLLAEIQLRFSLHNVFNAYRPLIFLGHVPGFSLGIDF